MLSNQIQKSIRFDFICDQQFIIIVQTVYNQASKSMFFELNDIDKIQTGITALSQLKDTIERKSLQTYSSKPQRVDASLKNTLTSVLQDSQKAMSVLKDIQEQVQLGYFVPSSLNLDELVYDPTQLPEWFEFVFNKEYEKQKKNLDGLCKKAYKMQSLHEVKFNLQKEIQSFKLLVERYEIVSQKQKSALNIMGEAELVSIKCKGAKQKFNHFCKSIADKIVTFLQQTISKSMNFSNSMNTVGQSVTNSFNVKLQPEQFQRGYLTNKFKENSAAYETEGFYRSRAPKSVDFHGKTMYGRMGTDFGRTGFDKTGGFGKTGGLSNANGFGNTGFAKTGFNQVSNEYKRYVPRHLNSTVYDFYH